jgi:glycosyltransferase involved in cell wall biosynthesis
MRILGVARTLPFHSIGGMQAIAWDLFKEFARLGHTVTVLTTAIPGKPTPFTLDGVLVVPLPGSTPERSNAYWWKASAQWFIDKAAAHVDGVLSISAAGASIAAKRRHAPHASFIFQAHGTSWGEIVSKWRTRRPLQIAKSVRNFYWLFKDAFVYRDFDQIALVGDVLRQQFHAAPVSWMTRDVKTVLIRNGVNEHVFKPDAQSRAIERAALGWADTSRVAVFAARLHPQKGGEVALRAFAALSTALSEARLLIIGGGEDLERLKGLAQSLGCGDKVHFTGPVARERMAPLLSAGDAFAFPTLRQEGLPMNVLEALSVGLRPVCSEGTRSVFDPNLPITYADPQDIAAFTATLSQALHLGGSTTSLLSPSYFLSHCALQYLDALKPIGPANHV